MGLDSGKKQKCQDDNKKIGRAFENLYKKPCAVSSANQKTRLRNLQKASPKKDDKCTKEWSNLSNALKRKETKLTFWSKQNTLLKKTCSSKKAKKRILFRKRVLQAATPKKDEKNDTKKDDKKNKKADSGSKKLKCEDKSKDVLRGEYFVCLNSYSALLKSLLAGVVVLFAFVN